MAENSKIEWTHHTFNPWEGCTKIGPGCDHCYAETRNNRFGGGNWGPGAPRRKTSQSNWQQPIKWNKQAAASGVRYRVFCASLADVFDNEVDPKWRAELFLLIKQTPNLDWLLLTKRIGNTRAMLPDDWGRGYPNVWLGATVVNQEEAARDIPKLLSTPAAIRWLSMEPLLAPVDFAGMWVEHENPAAHQNMLEALDWIVLGGESGPGARPMHPEWARSIQQQCAALGVPFLFKQWGEWCPRGPESLGYQIHDTPHRIRLTDTGDNGSILGATGDNECWMQRAGKKLAGRTLDGKLHDEYPAVRGNQLCPAT